MMGEKKIKLFVHAGHRYFWTFTGSKILRSAAMLTLLEPPGGAKRSPNVGGNYNNRSAQHLLNLSPEEDDLYDQYDEEIDDFAENEPQSLLDKFLVWRTSSSEFNERWKREFRQRPSWCDADLCLQQIKRGKATGNQWALYSRSFIQKVLFALGQSVQRNAFSIILMVSMVFAVCCYGLQYVHIETDIVKLWVSQGGRLDFELNFLPNIKQKMNLSATEGEAEIPRENGLGGGYQVLIQTPEFDGQNALDIGPLLKHVEIMKDIASFNVTVHGEQWSLSDICFKPAPPSIDNGSIAGTVSDVIDRIVPCIWITPIDCFWEGSKALGPHPQLPKKALGLFSYLISTLPEGETIRWSDFDPIKVINEIHNAFNLGSHYTFFERAGVGHGYMDRPCIDPLDPECPEMSPNHFDVCPHIDRIREIARANGEELKEEKKKGEESSSDWLDFLRSKRSVEGENSTLTTTTTTTTEPTTTLSPEQIAREKELELSREATKRKERCDKFRKSSLQWIRENKDKWSQVLTEDKYPKTVDYGKIMSEGCNGFASNVLHWPVDMILGGAKRDEQTRQLKTADALQSVFLVASPNDIYLRFKQKPGKSPLKKGLNMTEWNEKMAEAVLTAWQRNFTRNLYDHKDNRDENGAERRTLHPLASTSIADMLEEFCQFNYTIIFVGYGLMLAYAILTQVRIDRWLPSAESSMGLAFAGVVVVTFASVAGLGLATWFGIEFNAATTQIVPFLTLGIGVDNMFMLLYNYRDLLKLSGGRNDLAILMKETGMSILCTSINNILAFLTGTLLPIPALRSFCAQSSILLTFNFIAILTIYPAIISFDLRRRKSNRRDVLFCLHGNQQEESYSMISKPKLPNKRIIGAASEASIIQRFDGITNSPLNQEENEEATSSWLNKQIHNHYIPLLSRKSYRAFVLGLCVVMLSISTYGLKNTTLGLELSDVLPEHTAPAQFLRARDKYFSFYPMFAVLQGPNINYAEQQIQIENYRKAIGASKYVIKNSMDEPSEKYWLGLMRDWLISIQEGFDQEMATGEAFDLETGEIIGKNVSEDARIAHALICSKGNVFECKGRIGTVRLVDKSGVIHQDAFYNYLTAWFNVDHMMYYVSQASFFPTPPKWSLKKNSTDNFVPPAQPLAYSQIPFYLTGLTDTPVIVEMIKDIRGVCERFTDNGLPNFPQGIAFTFWEQYLFLAGNLTWAIFIILSAVFAVITLILFSPRAAALILGVLVIITFELAGFMGLVGIKLNPVSAVTLITAVGIGVEFTVHVIVAFLTSLGDKKERTASAVDRVFVPVIHGAFSTLLGIVMLSMSEFEFVVKYFFVVMSALIASGVFNGLFLLPVILSIMGPGREITPTDGKSLLNLPPPLTKRNRRCATSRNSESDEDDEPSGLVMFSKKSNQPQQGNLRKI
ncbi:unnamed protein product [Caenorhabditis angaria]|uniref:SSD domain-containing protein n=1 Tax=Caenorhabditis angaria TaxID=860376 RepID=A0A9P1IBQ6_9PELO|nr:unnamed protein product [Caenorhabditis angaria]